MNAATPIHIVPATEIPVVWPYVEPGIKAVLAITDGEYTVEGTYAELMSGATFLMLFNAHEAALGIIFTFIEFPGYKSARVLFAFGRAMEEMTEEILLAEQWAKAQGCKFVEAYVRTQSRARLFSRFGYLPKWTVLRKELT